MEERVPPLEPHPFLDQPHDDTNNNELVIAGHDFPKESNTLVIQVPKDQIYRVPPPENAKIVEAYRNPAGKNGRRHFPICLYVLLGLLSIGLVCGTSILIIKTTNKPRPINFSIVDLSVVNKKHVEYRFNLKSRNPSGGHLSVKINKGGVTWLMYKSHKFSTGEFPELSFDGPGSKSVRVKLHGLKSGLPQPVDLVMNGDEERPSSVTLELKMDLSVEYKLGFIDFWGKKDMEVECKLKVKSLKSSGNKILSQECDSQFT